MKPVCRLCFMQKKDLLHCSVKLRFNLDYVQIICMNQFSMANKTQKHPLFISPCIMQQHGFSSYPGQRWRSLGVSADFIIARVVLKSTFTPKGKNKIEYSFHFNSSQIKFDYLNEIMKKKCQAMTSSYSIQISIKLRNSPLFPMKKNCECRPTHMNWSL